MEWKNDEPVSKCPNMTSNEIELIDAISVFYFREPLYFQDNNKYNHYISCLNKLNVKCGIDMIDKMIVLDYIMFNHDRHFKNFGVLRNSQNINDYTAAPIYDTGSSLFYEDREERIKLPEYNKMRTECFDSLENQLKLVKDWSWYKSGSLKGIGEECTSLLLNIPSVEEKRAVRIGSVLDERCKNIHRV